MTQWATLIHKAAHGNRGLTLENLDDALPEGGEEHIEQVADAHEDALETLEHTNEALESITGYTSRLEKLIENKTVTLESLSLIRMAVESQLDRIGQEITYPSLEGVDEGDVEAQAKVALEGFKDFLNNMAQAYVMTFKHIRDALIDSSKFVSVALPRHEKKMLECRRHWQDVKGNLSDAEIRFAPIGFEYFLTLGNMQGPKGDELVKAIKEDVQVDKYLLVTYPKSIMSELSSVISAINGASVKSVADIVKLGKKIEGYKTPEELLDNKFADKAVMFGANVGVAKTRGKKVVKDVDGAETQLNRLAEMAGSGAPRMKVGMRSAIYQTLNAVSGALPAYTAASLPVTAPASAVLGTVAALHGVGAATKSVIHAGMESSNYFVKTKDIPSFFDAAEGYLDNIRAHLSMEREFIRVVDACDGAIEKLEDRVGEAYESKMHGKEASQDSFDKAWAETDVAMKVIKQIMQFMDALSRSIMRVSAFEQRRAFHAAKSCNYIGMRLIFNAPAKKVATEGRDEDAQENIRKMDEALNAHHEHYESEMRKHADNPAKFAELQRDKANGEHSIRTKFNNSHPALEDEGHQPTPDELRERFRSNHKVVEQHLENLRNSKEANDAEWEAALTAHRENAATESIATEGAKHVKDKGTEGKIEGTGKHHVGKMVACNFAEGPEVVKVVAMHFHEGKTTYLAKKPGKGEYLVAQASGEQAEHGCFMHCQEVMLGMADEGQAKEVFGGKVKAIPPVKKTGETK